MTFKENNKRLLAKKENFQLLLLIEEPDKTGLKQRLGPFWLTSWSSILLIHTFWFHCPDSALWGKADPVFTWSFQECIWHVERIGLGNHRANICLLQGTLSIKPSVVNQRVIAILNYIVRGIWKSFSVSGTGYHFLLLKPALFSFLQPAVI